MEGSKSGEKREFDLNLCTKGHCFLCLNATNASNDGGQSSREFKNLCKHLKIDMVKLVSENIKTPQIVNKILGRQREMEGESSVLKTKMKVDLCSSCEEKTAKFSKLFQTLERIQMEIDHCLETIHEGISEGGDNLELMESFQELMSEDINSLLLLGFIDELKKEIYEKCKSTKFTPQSYQVNLKNPIQINVLPSNGKFGSVRSSMSSCYSPVSSISGRAASLARSETSEDSKIWKFKCRICSEMFPNAVAVRYHKDKVHKSQAGDESKNEEQRPPEFTFTASGRKVKTFSYSKLDFGEEEDEEYSEKRSSTTSVIQEGGEIVGRVKYERDGTGMYKCPFASCPKQFSNKKSMYQHKYLEHSSKSSVKKPSLKNKVFFDANKNKFKCRAPFCPKLYNTRNSATTHYYREHFRKNNFKDEGRLPHPGPSSDRSQLPTPTFSLKNVVFDESSGKYKCPEANCASLFISKFAVKIHYESKHLKIRYKCDNCQAKYTQPQHLRKHKAVCPLQNIKAIPVMKQEPKNNAFIKIKRVKKRQERRKLAPYNHKFPFDATTGKYKCSEVTCSKQFTTTSNANIHFESIHLKIRHKCDRCNDAEFVYFKELNRHKRICTGAEQSPESVTPEPSTSTTEDGPPLKKKTKLYNCNLCWKSFPNGVSVRHHKDKVHGGANSAGDLQNFAFDKQTKKYKCSEEGCQEQFIRLDGAHSHFQMIHLNLYYKCEECKKHFKHLSDLNTHKETCPEGDNFQNGATGGEKRREGSGSNPDPPIVAVKVEQEEASASSEDNADNFAGTERPEPTKVTWKDAFEKILNTGRKSS